MGTIFVAVLAALGLGGIGDETPSPSGYTGWQEGRLSMSWETKSKTNEASIDIPTAYAMKDGLSQLYFVCDASTYRLRIAETPVPIDGFHGTQDRKVRSKSFLLYIDDELVYRGTAQHYMQLDFYAPMEREPAAKLFNAVVRGQTAAYSIKGRKEQVPLWLPPMDDEFKSFVKACKDLAATYGGN
ncbi:hypothetical protein [Parvularcula sp. LCG005]|uniref:hypothetical protein n=1 Tax=Parvularcula sp. LCG005 TaxID=3078805 RepID=UPI0029439DA2|nr:hypothetical protein [Parvularcula sp. LCG005]WOI53799.1 hypothetical protein RUI03_02080 [Parvularcula sp. LCG005]